MTTDTILKAARARAASMASGIWGSIRTARTKRRSSRPRKSERWFCLDERPAQFEFPELALLKIGLVLFSLYMLLRVDAIANSSRDLAWFDGRTPDTTLWSASRVDLYRSASTPPADALIGALIIPSLTIAAPIYVDTSEVHLNRGVGLVPAMAAPGTPGNVGIAGHRDGHFRALKDIQPGDAIEILTHDRALRYRVVSIAIVEHTDTSVLRSTHSPTLTLVTCYPFYFVGSAPQRFIVRSELVSSQARSVVVSSDAMGSRRQP